MEKLVVFDFDDTIYAHSREKVQNSCRLTKTPAAYQISDKRFLKTTFEGLINHGINIGVASFGKKDIIIQTMNEILYGEADKIPIKPYFDADNVLTAPDVEDEWIIALSKVSNTFKQYIKDANNDVDAAFMKFSKEQQPETNPKMYYCMNLDPIAKVKMIRKLCDHYKVKSLSEVRFFDDNKDNVKEALEYGVIAHQVPHYTGLTKTWWRSQCKLIDCGILGGPVSPITSSSSPKSRKRSLTNSS